MNNTFARVAFFGLITSALTAPCMAQGNRYGVVASMNEQNEADAVQNLNAGAIRFTLYWDETEPGPGSFDFSVLNVHLDLTVPYGRSIYISAGERTPSWAGSCPTCAPFDPNTYGDFVEQVIRHTYDRYPSADVVFGVWNEPNLGVFLNDTSDAQQYAAMFQAASAARDRVSSSIRLGAPETSHHGVTSNSYFNSAMSRIAPFMHGNDVVTVHWYPDAPLDLGSYMSQVTSRAGGREMWLTETGLATCDDTAQLNRNANIIDIFDRSTANWARTFIYRLRGGSNCDESIVRADWSTRASFNWYRDHIGAIVNSATMTANQVLLANQSISSSNGQYTLVYQGDGNLVLYRVDGLVMWTSNTSGSTTGQVVMQGDGNLVVYNGSGDYVWASNTSGNPGAYLAVQNNGHPVVYRANNSKAWECVNQVCLRQ
jgi:hypothetical protein